MADKYNEASGGQKKFKWSGLGGVEARAGLPPVSVSATQNPVLSLRFKPRHVYWPGGPTDNSPAFQRREKFGVEQVPQGRLNNCMSYVSSYHHCVFSTKERRALITPALAERLWPFLGGIARQNKMKVIEVGGVADHVHLLLSIPPSMSVAKAMQLIKGGSSKWVHETFSEHWAFGWQEKYGAFSVSESRLAAVIEYIKGQPEHHKQVTFQEEFVALLQKHRIEFDERYLWD